MSIFNKAVSDLETNDLARLLADEAEENVRLEFKEQVPSRNETLKKLSSMANTYGGFLVIGAGEDGAGKLASLPGVDPPASFKQTIVQWCQGGVYPPIDPHVSAPIPAPQDAGKVLYVVYVHESLAAPHFLEGRRGAYVRTDEFSQRFEPRPATYREIQHLADRRAIAVERRSSLFDRADARFREFIVQDYEDAPGTEGPPGAMLALSLCPAFPVNAMADQAELHAFVQSERISWRQVLFPRAKSVLTQHESVLDLHSAYGFSILEASTWGHLYYATEIERVEANAHSIHLNSLLGHILIFAVHASTFFRHFGFNGILDVRLRLTGMRGVHFDTHQATTYDPVLSRFDDVIDFSLTLPAEQLFEQPRDLVGDVYRLLFFAVNWPDATGADGVQKLLARADDYNNLQ
jgi:schlafen family protein